MGKKVIVAGHICLDITPVFPDKKVSGVSEMLAPGKLIEMGNADVHTGGAVANTGLALKLLGADVSLMGKTGRDAFGDMVAEILKRYGAAEGLIRAEGESTSYSVVLAIPGIDRIFLHHPGANHTFRAADIPRERIKDAALFHFGYPPLMRFVWPGRPGLPRRWIWRRWMPDPRQGKRTGEGFWSGRCPMWISLCRVSKNCAL